MAFIPNTTAIILAGGQSARMGQDKGLMDLNGQPMIQYIIETVSMLTDNILIVANNADYKKFGLPIYEDVAKGKGPLAGIVTGLSATKTELNWIISCDAPYVSVGLLKDLMDSLKTVDVVIPFKDEKVHPLIGAYQKATLAVFEEELESNHLKIMTIISRLDVQVMDANQFDVLNFKNLNSKKDL